MTPEQTEALNKARQAALNLKKQADKAHSLGLTVLEQWLRDASVGCQAGADFQVRAHADNLATQTAPKVIDNKPNPPEGFFGFHDFQSNGRWDVCLVEGCGKGKAHPIHNNGQTQADVTADAIKRRGLV